MNKLSIIIALSAISMTSQAKDFVLQSPDITSGEAIPQEFAFDNYGCTGNNTSPALTWSNPPKGTKSFAVQVHDPDAVTGGAGFWHWVVVDIPKNVSNLQQGVGKQGTVQLPNGARQIATDFGAPGWGGPCPPEADKPHNYSFTIHALGIEKLGVPDNATAGMTGFMINQNSLGSATFNASYDR